MPADTPLNKACQLQQAGRIPEALVIYEEILRENSIHPDALHLAGLSHHQMGNAEAALPLLQKAVEQIPGSALYRSNLALVLVQANQLANAEQEARRAIQLDANQVTAHVSLGLCLTRTGQLKDAGRAYQSALAIDPDCFDAHNNLAKIFRDLREHDTALEHGISATKLQPQNCFIQNNLANIYNDLGELDKARTHYEKAIELKPTYGQAWSNWSHTLKFGANGFEAASGRIPEMENLLKQANLSSTDRGNLLFALAKAHKDYERHDEAVPLYEEANRLLCPRPFPFDQYRSYLQKIRLDQTRGTLSNAPSSGNEAAPIFIIGMLRSGTSLTEQILSSHSMLGGVGERKDVAVLTNGLSIRGLATGQLSRLSETYLKNIAAFHKQEERPVDKMMTNFLHLGFIFLLFPKAKIIHIKRQAYDVCLSCFFQNFATAPAWASSLEAVGKYYALYEEMMEHWKNELLKPVFELQYEDLVSRPEQTIRGLLEYCEVPWEENCLNFYESKHPVQTASNWQVRQKLHTGSVGNWKRYEKFLAPLKKQLGDR